MICPLCKGKGKIPFIKTIIGRDRAVFIKKMKDGGLTEREIMGVFGYKSRRSLYQYLEYYSLK